MLRRKRADHFRATGVVERLARYGTSTRQVVADDEIVEPELVERAATLLGVMPGNQRRETIEQLLSPHDRDRGRRAVDALIDTAFAVEDGAGRLRRVA